jgi:hypothetical protein
VKQHHEHDLDQFDLKPIIGATRVCLAATTKVNERPSSEGVYRRTIAYVR